MHKQSESRMRRNTGLRRWIRRGKLWCVRSNTFVCLHITYLQTTYCLHPNFNCANISRKVLHTLQRPNKLSQARLIVSLCRLWEEHVQDVAYRGRPECRGGRVPLASQPPHQRLQSCVRGLHHQSSLAGHCCPLCAR